MTNNLYQPHASTGIASGDFEASPLYRRVMLWLVAQFAVTAASAFLLGPIVPPQFVLPMMLLLVGALIISSFVRFSATAAPVFAILVPALLGVALYSTLGYYLSVGAGSVVLSAAVGTLVIFGTMATIGYTSKRSLASWNGRLFAILLGLIAVSVTNTLWLKLDTVSLLVSCVVVVLFSIYIFIDIQKIRDNRDNPDAPAASYALGIYLDIYNIFVALLNILSFFRN